MPENAPQQPEMYPEPKRGTWHGPEHDVPVVILGSYGLHEDNREYLIAEGGVGIPADEFEQERPPEPDIFKGLRIRLAFSRSRSSSKK